MTHISPIAEDMIKKLICDRKNRLGTKGGVDEIRKHPFFKGVKWNTIANEKAAYLPEVKHETDTRNFDDFKEETDYFGDGPVPRHKTDKDITFVGYTYKRFDVVKDRPKLNQDTFSPLPEGADALNSVTQST